MESKGSENISLAEQWYEYTVCPESKCTDFLFKYLLDLPEITSDLLQSM